MSSPPPPTVVAGESRRFSVKSMDRKMSSGGGVFAIFEDLLEDGSVADDVPPGHNDGNDGDDDSDDESLVHKLDANALTLNELLQELEKRGLHARGFFADDAKVLQGELDREHEVYVETKRREKREARELEARQARLQRRRSVMEAKVREERDEISRDRRMKTWLDLIRGGGAPAHSRIEANDITARSLAKALLEDKSALVSLDVSYAGLADLAGAFLCRALRDHRTIIKLELGGNLLGPKTCRSLGNALSTNRTVRSVSLESNPLTGDKQDDLSGIWAIADMLRKNQGLRYLSLLRCNIGPEGGKEVAEALCSNDVLTCIELGYNGWEKSHIRKIAQILVS